MFFDQAAASLVAAAATENIGLLPSTFGNFVEGRYIEERLMLYAKLQGWSEERFCDFMLAPPFYSARIRTKPVRC